MTEPSRYDQLSPLARALVDDYDALDLAEMLVKAQDELAAHRAAYALDAPLHAQLQAAIKALGKSETENADLRARVATLEHVAAGNKRHVQLIVPDLQRAEAAIARVRAIPRLPHSSQQTGELGRAYTRGWESLINALDTALNPPEEQAAAWTPPPPGDTREQLPEHLLALIRDRLPDYLSTACQTADLLACAACFPGSGVPRPQYDELREHAERLHARCRLNHKFTGQLCTCGCHETAPAATEATEPQEQP